MDKIAAQRISIVTASLFQTAGISATDTAR